MQYNPKDPMNKTEDRARRLFLEMSKLCNGAPNDVIIQAAFNIVLNAIRQKNARLNEALSDFDQMASKLRSFLADHYFAATGKRRNIFPFHQTIEPQHFDARDPKFDDKVKLDS